MSFVYQSRTTKHGHGSRYNGEAINLEVNNKVDYESGPNWGTINEDKLWLT